MSAGWDEEFCKRLDKVPREDHSYIATWEGGQRYEKNGTLCLHTQGPVGPMKSRTRLSRGSTKNS